ncbi:MULTISPECIES: ATP-binding cassette domain-containing protein [Caproicibacterium]|uniref:ATP-binding cassette domain-containing protein n=1 Tax=Caproicibacterium argilliputei TaxID=3030016 RepID=A0AA97D9C8_9FIRM|nr:ATP-binding cassette domain-containing protein [Caproicibacterium argilliputei]WOC31709.1 ATP-binding cassette domain-containing protein [Caproicibacterium argilliputei]
MIEIDDITYGYSRGAPVFRGFSAKMCDGEAWGLVGFNGAGKSTLLKIILGIIKPKTGHVEIDGKETYKHRRKLMYEIGVTWGQKPTLWWDVPVRESYQMLKSIYKIPAETFKHRLEELDAAFCVSAYWKQPLRTLSLGQRVKAEIVGSLLHTPQILIYDEPFLGLDFLTRKKIIETLLVYRRNHPCTFLLTSHNLADIEELCDHFLLISSGETLYQGRVEAVTQNFCSKRKINVSYQNASFHLSESLQRQVKLSDKAENVKQIFFDTKQIGYQKILQDILASNTICNIKTDDNLLEQVIENLVSTANAEHGA